MTALYKKRETNKKPHFRRLPSESLIYVHKNILVKFEKKNRLGKMFFFRDEKDFFIFFIFFT